MTDIKTLAGRIKDAIDNAKKRGVTIGDIATACSVSVQSVYQWMKAGERKEIDGTKLVELAEITGYHARWIMTGKGRRHSDVSVDAETAKMLQDWAVIPDTNKADIRKRINLIAQAYRDPVEDGKLGPQWTHTVKTEDYAGPDRRYVLPEPMTGEEHLKAGHVKSSKIKERQ